MHDDFRLENVLLGDCGTVQAVLDWEMGDVSEDQRIVLGDIESRFENAALLLERADLPVREEDVIQCRTLRP